MNDGECVGKKRVPVQLELIPRRGGKRRGAGRPPNGERAGSGHKKRPDVKLQTPVHITLRVRGEVGNLRRKGCYEAVRRATLVVSGREDFRIVQMSMQHNHVHLLIEAHSRAAMTRGLQGFEISAAKQLNAVLARKGKVFADRYFAVLITSPTQARHTLSYVLNNFRRHQEWVAKTWKVDWYSSGISFDGWIEYDQIPAADPSYRVLWRGPPTYNPLVVDPPRSWLLAKGWKLAGTISCYDVPSARR